MKVNYFAILYLIFLIMVCSCETPKVAQKPAGGNPEFVVSDDLILNFIDSMDVSALRWDNTGDGVFGRKIIYRDLKSLRAAPYESGTIQIKVCIDRNGIVKYAEVFRESSTIKDIRTLKSYLKAASKYKFEPSTDALKYECGKIAFRIDNSRNRTLR
jgi:hypothetical protein